LHKRENDDYESIKDYTHKWA